MQIGKCIVATIKLVAETIALTFFGMFASYINLIDILCTGIALTFVVVGFAAYIPALILVVNPKIYDMNIRECGKKFLTKDFFIKKFSKSAIKKLFKPILTKISGPIFARIIARLSLIGIGLNI
ncbi:MAG: hypothetical protein ATN34_02905 [Epulopiscium sp. Nele67-Bin002]|nr:MAG: hypothetical protein BEN18_09160 [Epulopiscium sp. Nuni2H_MBin001]OON91991.1 MAG: hypothetical protein ATN34_02905 [Epulopiscium sp. Nele67-Bin002]